MKKILSLLLMLSVLLLFASCEISRITSAASNSSPAYGGIAKDDVKIGVLFDADPENGSGAAALHLSGINYLKQKLAILGEQIVMKTMVAPEDTEAVKAAAKQCIDDGCNVIIGTASGYDQAFSSLAGEHSKVFFSVCNGKQSNGKNLNNYNARMYQALYLAGVAACMNSESKKIGFISSFDNSNPEVANGVNAFALGVQSVNLEAKVHLKIIGELTNDQKETAAANDLIKEGCDVVANNTGSSASVIAADKKDVWAIGVNPDTNLKLPDKLLTATMWNWGAYYVKLIAAVVDGKFAELGVDGNYYGGLKDGAVGLFELNEDCEEKTAERIKKSRDFITTDAYKIYEAKIIVPDGYVADYELRDINNVVVCVLTDVYPDDTIKNKINWYYQNIVIASSPAA